MQEIGPSSRNGPTPSSNTLMSNLQAQISSNTPIAGRSKNGDSHLYQLRRFVCGFPSKSLAQLTKETNTLAYIFFVNHRCKKWKGFVIPTKRLLTD